METDCFLITLPKFSRTHWYYLSIALELLTNWANHFWQHAFWHSFVACCGIRFHFQTISDLKLLFLRFNGTNVTVSYNYTCFILCISAGSWFTISFFGSLLSFIINQYEQCTPVQFAHNYKKNARSCCHQGFVYIVHTRTHARIHSPVESDYFWVLLLLSFDLFAFGTGAW